MKNIYIVYHKIDFDGVCSAAIVYWSLKKYNNIHNIFFVPINYGDVFDLWDKVDMDDTVYMVDFSLPIKDLIALNNLTNLILIDHHKTIVNDIQKSGIEFNGIQKSGIGACYLTYNFINEMIDKSDPFCPDKYEYVPYAIELLAKYDVWDLDDPNALTLQYALRCIDDIFDPTNEIWKKIVFNEIDIYRLIDKGRIAQQYDKVSNAKYCDTVAFDSELDGYKLLCVNKALGSSIIFESIWDNTKYDIMCCFYRVKGTWNASFYTDKEGVDVGELAKKYGGGGHKQAAGIASVRELPFDV